MSPLKEPLSCDFGDKILSTQAFQDGWHKLPVYVQRQAKAKIALLQHCPRCPSLQSHRLQSLKDGWICYLNRTYRMIYRQEQNRLTLVDIGHHSIVDRGHLYRRRSVG